MFAQSGSSRVSVGAPSFPNLAGDLRFNQDWLDAEAIGAPSSVQGGKWFAEPTFFELRKIWGLITSESNPVDHMLKAAFSSILISSCRETRHWGYVCDNSQPKTNRIGESKKLFLSALERFKRAHLARTDGQDSSLTSKIVCQDSRIALKSLDDGEIDCFVTSPTYLGVADYINPHFPSIVDIQCGEKAILL